MTRPYSTSKADPIRAQGRIRQMLMKFGVDRIIFDEDFGAATFTIKFKYRDYPVSMPIDYGKLAKMYLEEDTWTSRKRVSRVVWEEEKKRVAYNASFSLLEDFLKSLITIVELGVFSFEEIFISYFTDNRGNRFGDVLTKRLPDFMSGRLALKDKNAD